MNEKMQVPITFQKGYGSYQIPTGMEIITTIKVMKAIKTTKELKIDFLFACLFRLSIMSLFTMADYFCYMSLF